MKIKATKESGRRFKGAFKAVIIYDDVGRAARAVALLERAAARADAALKCDVKLWRVDALRQPTLAAITNAVAADASVVLFALDGVHAPADELLHWLKDWSANRQIEDAAIVLYEPEADAGALLRNGLEQLAGNRGLAFFGAGEAGTDEAVERGIYPPPRREPQAEPDPFPPAEPMPAASHWGIND